MRDAMRAVSPAVLVRTRFSTVAATGAAAMALIVGVLAVRSPQTAVTLVLLLLLLAIRSESRPAGMVTLWTYWLLAPFLRRLMELTVASPEADPLSLLPFLGTAMLAILELRSDRLDRRARTILVLAAGGFLIGVPGGMTIDPAAVSFAAVAYLAGLSAFVLGWGDGVRPASGGTLERTLAAALIPLAIYGIAQFFFPLSAWDSNWVDTSGLNSLGSPQEGHVRVFAALNSPFTFAIVLASGILLGLGVKRRLSVGVLLNIVVILALALTFMRSVWLALVIGLIVFTLAARGKASGRMIAIVVICLVGVVVLGDSNPTTQAFTNRVTSLGDPENDVSAQERLATTRRLVPESLRQPLGAGLGQAGLAVRLEKAAAPNLVSVDDGYLSLLYQSGPFGFLLTVGALLASVGAAARSLSRGGPDGRLTGAALLATLVMLLVALAAADVFFGLPGAILWYLCGLAVARARSPEAAEV